MLPSDGTKIEKDTTIVVSMFHARMRQRPELFESSQLRPRSLRPRRSQEAPFHFLVLQLVAADLLETGVPGFQ
jgi:hypothetical protein